MIHYGLEIALSLTLTAIVLNLTLYCRMRFGDTNLTKISARPFILAQVLLVFMLAELSLFSAVDTVYEDRLPQFSDFVAGNNAPLVVAVSYLSLGKYYLILAFVLSRAHEHEALVVFVVF